MPVPTPREGESKDEFLPRCIAFMTEENKKKPEGERRPLEQLRAICYGQLKSMESTVRFGLSNIKFLSEKPNAMKIEGELLKAGVWAGLDGTPVRYTKAFIDRVEGSLVGKPIVFAHELSPESMDGRIEKGETVGFWTGTNVSRDTLFAKGLVFHPVAISYLQKHPHTGLSMEAKIRTTYSSGFEEAEDGILTGGALIESPACKTCRVLTAREINLERGQHMEEFIVFQEGATPTRDAFFAWLEEQLKNDGVPPEIISKVLETMKKAVKTPYPYPAPKSQQAEILAALHSEKELSEYSDFMKTCMADKNDLQACVADWKKKGEAPAEKPPEEEKPLQKELELTKKALEELKKTVDSQKDGEIKGLVSSISELDKDFCSTKFLEGVDCKDLQLKMLQKYVETLKKNAKPIQLQIGAEAAKAKVQQVVDEMLGKDATVESVMGVS